MIRTPLKTHQQHEKQLMKEYDSREEMSLVMSVASRKQDYAIQSIPHHINHRKSAYGNYFNPTASGVKVSNRFQTQIFPSNSASSQVKATKTSQYCFVNNYHKNITTLPRIIKSIIHKRLEQIFKSIHCAGVTDSNWNQKQTDISAELNCIQIKSMLISTAGKQSIRSTQHTLQMNEKHFRNTVANVPVHNKLLLVEGKHLIQNCCGKQSRLSTPKK